MSAIEDLIEGLIHVGILSVSYAVGQEAQRSLVKSAEENNWLGVLFSAIVCGGSAYAFQSSARDLNRLIRKNRIAIPQRPILYLPK